MKKRTKVIQRLLKKKNIDCLVVAKAANVTYTTGFLGDDSWAIITKCTYLTTTEEIQLMQNQSYAAEALEDDNFDVPGLQNKAMFVVRH